MLFPPIKSQKEKKPFSIKDSGKVSDDKVITYSDTPKLK